MAWSMAVLMMTTRMMAAWLRAWAGLRPWFGSPLLNLKAKRSQSARCLCRVQVGHHMRRGIDVDVLFGGGVRRRWWAAMWWCWWKKKKGRGMVRHIRPRGR